MERAIKSITRSNVRSQDMLFILQQWRQLEELCRVAALYKDVSSLGLVCCYCLFYLLHIVEQAEPVRCVAVLELGANEPYGLYVGSLKHVHNLLMLVVANLAKLLHIANDNHLVVGLDLGKVVERGSHACRVGIVGIYDKAVVLGLLKLRAVVGRNVARQCVVYLLGAHTEVETYGCGGKHIGNVVFTDEVGVHGVPCGICRRVPLKV